MSTEPKTIDLTTTYWGHNFNVINWAKGRLAVWATPGPKEGDLLLLQGHQGVIRARVLKSDWQSNVGDMYMLDVAPEVVSS